MLLKQQQYILRPSFTSLVTSGNKSQMSRFSAKHFNELDNKKKKYKGYEKSYQNKVF